MALHGWEAGRLWNLPDALCLVFRTHLAAGSLSAEHDVLYVAARAGTAWIAMFRAPVINSRMLPPCPTAVAAAAVKDAKRPRFDPFLD